MYLIGAMKIKISDEKSDLLNATKFFTDELNKQGIRNYELSYKKNSFVYTISDNKFDPNKIQNYPEGFKMEVIE